MNAMTVRSAAFAVLLALAMGSAPGFPGQETPDVVSVASVLSRDAVRPGETFKVALIVSVRPGYHINDSAPLDEFLYPTSLRLGPAAGIEVLETFYPAGRLARYDYSDAEVTVYEGEVVLGALLKADDRLEPGMVKLQAMLSYQACDDSTCFPPTEIGFEIVVPVVPASQKTVEAHPDVFEKIAFRTSTR